MSYVVRKKRHAAGATERSQRFAQKLTGSQILEIKAKLGKATHGDGKQIANAYGISQSMLSRIKNGECWKDVK